MSENLANLLRMMVEVMQNHGERLEALEREVFEQNIDDASSMEEVTSLLAELQNPQSGFATEPVPSDQV